MTLKQEYLRKLPKVDVLLKDEKIERFCGEYGREFVVEAIREELDELRMMILRESEGLQGLEGCRDGKSAREDRKDVDRESVRGTEKADSGSCGRVPGTE